MAEVSIRRNQLIGATALDKVWNRVGLTPIARLTAFYLAHNVKPRQSFTVPLSDVADWVGAFIFTVWHEGFVAAERLK